MREEHDGQVFENSVQRSIQNEWIEPLGILQNNGKICELSGLTKVVYMVKCSRLGWSESITWRTVEERTQNVQYSHWKLKNGLRISSVVDYINRLDNFRGLKFDATDAELCEILGFAYRLF
jgi:hypothetical protein